MTFPDLQKKNIKPIFSIHDISKIFPTDPKRQINTQLYRMSKRGDIRSIKRGLYCLSSSKLDEFVLASKLYSPSYISLETALNIYNIIPDIAINVTSVTTITSKKITVFLGTYIFSKINKTLFFGYKAVLDEKSGIYYNIAEPEKALLDFIYIRRVKNLKDFRVNTSVLNKEKLSGFSLHFPEWTRKVLVNE